ncbi:MAG: YD repeat-containing protein [candidate division NC10 bacterium CSP1-5]|nr:MAG: YD repeat-containing protein [candidate division NC10 bacterium CSP1-5]
MATSSLANRDGTHSFLHDPLNRLTQATHPQPANPAESFTYDPVGNRANSHLAAGQVYDAANRLLQDSNFTYTYDENGNLTSKTSKANGEVTTYTYDAENQLIRVERPGVVAEYRYDALGRRIEKVVGVSTRFIYDNEDIVVEVDSAAVAQAFYLHGPGIDEPLAMGRFGAGGGTAVFHADGLGSITTLTNTSGAPVRSYTYDSFGRLVAQTGTLTNPYTFTAREFDPEIGLYYYRARQYDPSNGRFLAEDDVQFAFLRSPASWNLYAYVLNNPGRYIDPNGHQPLDVCFPLPPGLEAFLGCFGSCAGKEVQENLVTLGRDLQRSAVIGTAFGVGVCAAIVIFEPYLLPTFPACAGVAAASTTGVLVQRAYLSWRLGQPVRL